MTHHCVRDAGNEAMKGSTMRAYNSGVSLIMRHCCVEY